MSDDLSRFDGISMGGRGTDPALIGRLRIGMQAPPKHKCRQTVISHTVWSDSFLTPEEAFDSRVHRLKEAGFTFRADREHLTVSWMRESGDHTERVTLTYHEADDEEVLF